jgi:hypothetical protein
MATASAALASYPHATFVLATIGCSQKHCNQLENDAVNLGAPAPSSSGESLSLYTANSGANPLGSGDANGDGCASNGTIFACKNKDSSPYLMVCGRNGDMMYNSCGGTDPMNPTTCVTDKLNAEVTTPLIGQDGSVIVADSKRIIRFYSASVFDRTVYTDVGTLSGTSWSTAPTLAWYYNLTPGTSPPPPAGGNEPGQVAIVTNAEGSPCLAVFTDTDVGTWMLSAPGESQGGCAE